MNHTPTPWDYNSHTQVIFADTFLEEKYNGNDVVVCKAESRHCSKDEMDANAARIVQCVNACEGVEKVEDMVTLFNEFADQLKNGVPVSITPNSIYGKLIISLKK